MKYRVLIERDEDGAFVAEVPSLPVCVWQGSTREEALTALREAIALYVESLEARRRLRADELQHVHDLLRIRLI